MKRVTKKSLDELALVMPVISEMNQRYYVGGNSGGYGDSGDSGGWGGNSGGYGDSGGFTDYGNGGGSSNGYGNSTSGSGDSGGYGDYSGEAGGSGGYSDSVGAHGSFNNPYTQSEYESFIASGCFPGGYVRFSKTDYPFYMDRNDKGETEIVGKFPYPIPLDDNNPNDIMYKAGFQAGFERGLHDDDAIDYTISGGMFVLGTSVPNELRGSDYDIQKSFWGAGFTQGYQKGRAVRNH